MPKIDDQQCDEIMHILGRMLGIIEISLTLPESGRRENLLQLRREVLQLNDLLQACHDVEDEEGAGA